MEEYYRRVVLLAPCTLTNFGTNREEIPDYKRPGYVYQPLTSIDIWKSGGFGWEEEKDAICDNFSADLCDWTNYFNEKTTTSIKLEEHVNQVGWANVFQEFVDDWSDPDNIYGKPYQIEEIEDVEVSLIVARNDQICPYGQAETLAARIPSLVNFRTIEDEDHFFFSYYSGDSYVNLLKRELHDG